MAGRQDRLKLQFWVATGVLCWSIALASVIAKTAAPPSEGAKFFEVTGNSPQSAPPAPAAQAGVQAATFIGDAKCIGLRWPSSAREA